MRRLAPIVRPPRPWIGRRLVGLKTAARGASASLPEEVSGSPGLGELIESFGRRYNEDRPGGALSWKQSEAEKERMASRAEERARAEAPHPRTSD